MMKIVNLGRTGLFVVMHKGAFATLGGRTHWRSLDDVRSALRSEKAEASDVVLRTLP